MSFKFDFDIDSEEEAVTTSNVDGNSCVYLKSCDSQPAVTSMRAQEIFVDQPLQFEQSSIRVGNCSERKSEIISLDNGHEMRCLSAMAVDQEWKQESGSGGVSVESDLIPHVYEGGLKIWDGSIDLLHFISKEVIPFSGLKVLELGCGVGLPGIYALTEGAIVHFQDYNEQVLKQSTIPNIILNSDLGAQGLLSNTRFFSGDWGSVKHLLLEGGIDSLPSLKYDIILTSETIYCLESYDKLHDIMKAVLKPSGVIYLAAKTFYFGVGGGTREFQKFIDDRAVFDSVVVKTLEHDGVFREIMKITFKTSAST